TATRASVSTQNRRGGTATPMRTWAFPLGAGGGAAPAPAERRHVAHDVAPAGDRVQPSRSRVRADAPALLQVVRVDLRLREPASDPERVVHGELRQVQRAELDGH